MWLMRLSLHFEFNSRKDLRSSGCAFNQILKAVVTSAFNKKLNASVTKLITIKFMEI